MSSPVNVKALCVRADGREILTDVDLALPAGAVTGLIGKNGAGKSTLLKSVVGIARPEGGSIRFGDGTPRLGYLPEYLGFVEHATGMRNLSLLAGLGRASSGDREDLGALLERVGLDPRDRRPVSSYSQGMRRRLGIAQAIMDDPQVAVFDEPTNGLDPDGIRWFRELARELAQGGVTVLISSHLLGELELSSDYLVMLHEGRVVFTGLRSELEQYTAALRVRVDDEQSERRLRSLFPGQAHGALDAVIEIDCPPPDAIEQMVAAGVRLRSVGPVATALEDLYVKIAK